MTEGDGMVLETPADAAEPGSITVGFILTVVFCLSTVDHLMCKYWIWMRPPAPTGGLRLVCPPALSGRLAPASYTQLGVSTCT